MASTGGRNRVWGTYTAGDDSLELEPGPSTRAACPADSLSDMYVNLLRTVTSYSVSSERMLLGLAADAGEMEFHDQP